MENKDQVVKFYAPLLIPRQLRRLFAVISATRGGLSGHNLNLLED